MNKITLIVRVFSVLYSLDDRYVISGSDDTNIRVWKAHANDAVKLLNKREEDARNYSRKLVDKYQYAPEIRKIKRHTHLPKYILNKKKELQIKKESKFRKLRNQEMNSKVGTIEHIPEKNKKVVRSEIIKK